MPEQQISKMGMSRAARKAEQLVLHKITGIVCAMRSRAGLIVQGLPVSECIVAVKEACQMQVSKKVLLSFAKRVAKLDLPEHLHLGRPNNHRDKRRQ